MAHEFRLGLKGSLWPLFVTPPAPSAGQFTFFFCFTSTIVQILTQPLFVMPPALSAGAPFAGFTRTIVNNLLALRRGLKGSLWRSMSSLCHLWPSMSSLCHLWPSMSSLCHLWPSISSRRLRLLQVLNVLSLPVQQYSITFFFGFPSTIVQILTQPLFVTPPAPYNSARKGSCRPSSKGTHFTFFTSTIVQILTQKTRLALGRQRA
jgi:hypothetical protein